jgi:ornithine cyclodeaminase/alanine dehydrogenase-like protein (mu-crystallin family)
VVPQRLHLTWNDNTLLAMPAATAGVLGTKLISVVPDNASRGLPTTNGLMILNDAQTGLPLAVLNAATLTAQRTGAVGALGTKYMTPADLDSVGIIGVGAQGTWQAIFTCVVRSIRHIFYVSHSPATAERFRMEVNRHVPAVKLTHCLDTRELLARTNLIITATSSANPVVPCEPALLEGKHFISIGSFRPAMQELPDSVYRLAGELAVDSESARHEVGDVVGPIERGILEATNIYFIGQLITGRRSVDVRHTTAYKCVGMALYDLAAAKLAYDSAARRGIGQEVGV